RNRGPLVVPDPPCLFGPKHIPVVVVLRHKDVVGAIRTGARQGHVSEGCGPDETTSNITTSVCVNGDSAAPIASIAPSLPDPLQVSQPVVLGYDHVRGSKRHGPHQVGRTKRSHSGKRTGHVTIPRAVHRDASAAITVCATSLCYPERPPHRVVLCDENVRFPV